MSIKYFVAFYNWDDPDVDNEHAPDSFQDEGPHRFEVGRARVEKEVFNMLSESLAIWHVGLLELQISPNGYEEADQTGDGKLFEEHYEFGGEIEDLKKWLSQEINTFISRRSRTEQLELTIRDTRFPKNETAQIEMI